MSRKPRPLPPGIPQGADRAEILRVDHAGEFGAVRIYGGQLDVLSHRRSARPAAAAIRKMADAERVHLETFNGLLAKEGVRPTALEPFWRLAGYALGAGTALLGTKAAMACTAAVEHVIDEHYARQIARLNGDPELKATLARFRDEEIAHRDEALARGAEEAPFYGFLSSAISGACRLAIALSERI